MSWIQKLRLALSMHTLRMIGICAPAVYDELVDSMDLPLESFDDHTRRLYGSEKTTKALKTAYSSRKRVFDPPCLDRSRPGDTTKEIAQRADVGIRGDPDAGYTRVTFLL